MADEFMDVDMHFNERNTNDSTNSTANSTTAANSIQIPTGPFVSQTGNVIGFQVNNILTSQFDGISLYEAAEKQAQVLRQLYGNPNSYRSTTLALMMRNGDSSAVTQFDLSCALMMESNHLNNGGAGDFTIEDIAQYNTIRRYSARQADGVVVLVHHSTIAFASGAQRMCHVPSRYNAKQLNSLLQVTRLSQRKWRMVFQAVGLLPLEKYKASNITVAVVESYGTDVPIGTVYPVENEEQYQEWWDKNVLHGRAKMLTIYLTYNLDASESKITCAEASSQDLEEEGEYGTDGAWDAGKIF